MAGGMRARGAGMGGGQAPVAARIDVRALRLPLEPGAFPELERDVRAYWTQVKSLARRSSAVLSESPGAVTPSFRELAYFDTPAEDLWRRGHRLFTRARIVRGAPTAGFELVHAFHGTDLQQVASAPVPASPQYEGRDVLREEVQRGREGGPASSYVRACTLREHRWEVGPRLSDAGRIFPGLSELPLLPTAPLRPVGDLRVEELYVALGEIDFGAVAGRISITVWRHARSGETLSLDLGIEMPYGRFQRASSGEKLRCETFERQLVEESGARVAAPRSTAGVLYARAHRDREAGSPA